MTVLVRALVVISRCTQKYTPLVLSDTYVGVSRPHPHSFSEEGSDGIPSGSLPLRDGGVPGPVSSDPRPPQCPPRPSDPGSRRPRQPRRPWRPRGVKTTRRGSGTDRRGSEEESSEDALLLFDGGRSTSTTCRIRAVLSFTLTDRPIRRPGEGE